MDDDPMLREVLGKMLRTLGYEATFAKDRLEALELFIDPNVRRNKKLPAIPANGQAVILPGGTGLS